MITTLNRSQSIALFGFKREKCLLIERRYARLDCEGIVDRIQALLSIEDLHCSIT